MADIVIFGNGKAASVARVMVERYGPHKIVGFTVDRAYKTENNFDGYPLVDWEDMEEEFPAGEVQLMGPITPVRLNTVRKERFLSGKKMGYQFASFIHPDNHIYTEDIGENCFILEQNVIHPFVTIGDNVMIWSQNHIGHHSTIGDHCFISVSVLMGGSVTLGPECYIAGGAGFVQGISLGKKCAILNGAKITHNLPDESICEGYTEKIKPYPSSRISHLL